MKTPQRETSAAGLTFIEILVIVTVLFILVGLLLPELSGSRRSPRINCVNNLKQVGLAMRMWANEHDEKFPWEVSDTNARPGSMEFITPGQTWRHFQSVSNELSSPKILTCPNDTRQRVATWTEFVSDKQLSYFVGLDANETHPQTILSGDRNLATSGKPAGGLLRLTAATGVEWTKEIHNRQGNFGLSDGSVQQLTISGLRKQIKAAIASETNRTEIRLLIP